MNFKFLLSVAVATLLVFASCSKSSELTDAIPADASYIVYLNNHSLIDKSEYDIFANPQIKQGLDFYKGLIQDKEKTQIIDDFLKNANALGINLKGDCYLYSNYNEFGLLLGVNDATKLHDVLIKMGLVSQEDIKKEKGIYSLSVAPGTAVAWDDSKFLFVVNMKSYYGFGSTDASKTNISDLAIAQLGQESDKSIKSNKSFVEFDKTKKDVSVFYSVKGMVNLLSLASASDQSIRGLDNLESFISKMKGVSFGINVSFEKGEVLMNSEPYFETAEDQTNFKQYYTELSGTLKGDHLKYFASNPLLLMSTNIKGNGIYNYLDKIGALTELNRNGSDSIVLEVENLIKNLDGDITFSLTDIAEQTIKIEQYDPVEEESFSEDITTSIPQIAFFADVKDPSLVLSFVKKMMDKERLAYKEVTPNVYVCSLDGFTCYFGVHNNSIFATNIQSLCDNLNNPDLKNNYAENIKNKSVFVTGDLQLLASYYEKEYSSFSGLTALKQLGKYNLTSSSEDYKSEGKLELVNKDKNSLAVICQQMRLEDVLSSMLGQVGF